jgi:hypothetical protein
LNRNEPLFLAKKWGFVNDCHRELHPLTPACFSCVGATGRLPAGRQGRPYMPVFPAGRVCFINVRAGLRPAPYRIESP